MTIEEELSAATTRILESTHPRKLVVAGPGTGKTWLFEKLLQNATGGPKSRLVLTFINVLKTDLEKSLGSLARVNTLHGFCFSLLKTNPDTRPDLNDDFECFLGLTKLVERDWEILRKGDTPKFLDKFRNLELDQETTFYLERSGYYNAVEFDDAVYRIHHQVVEGGSEVLGTWDVVLVDEFQDFNALESQIINALAGRGPIVIAGDDDQALYSEMRGAKWDFIRALHLNDEYEKHELPFCMRCTEVVVGAVNDVLAAAASKNLLDGRIPKPYKYYPPKKEGDSARYPQIDSVECTVQKKGANYFGKYIEQEIHRVDTAEVKNCLAEGGIPFLVIGPKQYLKPISEHLTSCGFRVQQRDSNPEGLDRETALRMLQRNPRANLGWRVLLYCGECGNESVLVRRATEEAALLVDLIDPATRERILAEAGAISSVESSPAPEAIEEAIPVKLVSYESAKGLSADHVFIVGLHNGDLPADPASVQDMEVCRFVVGLTRAKRHCTCIRTRNFAGSWKDPSEFLSWINLSRLRAISVNKDYWNGA